ncbi:MAG: hypothetical protein O3A00_20835 [Planctomycetota bacterium]|nr:hypothetical protein [Planctomycetota bacterium]
MYDEPEIVLTKTMLQSPIESWQMARYCFVIHPARFCLEDQLYLEFICGSELFSDVGWAPIRVRARFVNGPQINGMRTIDSLETKRKWLWQNKQRNDAIAQLAVALANRDCESLHSKSAITSRERDYWFNHPDFPTMP